MNDMNTFIPMDTCIPTKTHCASGITSLIFLKEGKKGEIKGQVCANGSKQKLYTSKED